MSTNSPWTNGVSAPAGLSNPAAVGITGGTIGSAVRGLYTDYAKWSIPFIKVATGTMGNNGAMTIGTALARTYSGGAYFLVPAGAVAAGVPAAATWYWGVASSTTAVTLYNSTYTSGVPATGVTTAFVTTGPGAFTGITVDSQGPTITLTGGSMGANGRLRVHSIWNATNNANAKTARVRIGGFAGTAYLAGALASQQYAGGYTQIINQNSQSLQIGTAANLFSEGATGGGLPTTSTVDTSADTTIVWSFNTSGAATDNQVLEAASIELMYGA